MDAGRVAIAGPVEKIMSDSNLMLKHGLESPKKFAGGFTRT
jgi:hypothetical protein